MNPVPDRRNTGLRGGGASPLLLTLGLLVTFVAAAGRAAADPPLVRQPGRILIIRGIFSVFSLGMDSLACQLTQLGYRVDVTPPSLAPLVAQQIQEEYLQDPSAGPLVIIGHSMGGRYCCSIPWQWREHDIPVRLVVILDSNPQIPMADNVQRCVNLYVTNKLGMFHGQTVWSVNPRADLVNTDVTRLRRPAEVPAVDHFNIDDSHWIHQMVIHEISAALAPDEDVPPLVTASAVESSGIRPGRTSVHPVRMVQRSRSTQEHRGPADRGTGR